MHNTQSFEIESLEVIILDEADRLLESGFRDELEEIVSISSFNVNTSYTNSELASISPNLLSRFIEHLSDHVCKIRFAYVRGVVRVCSSRPLLPRRSEQPTQNHKEFLQLLCVVFT